MTVRKYWRISLCFMLFSFAVYIPDKAVTVHTCILSAALYCVIFSAVLKIISVPENRIISAVTAAYLLFLMSRQIYLINNYLAIYHRNTWQSGSTLLVLLFLGMLLPLKERGIGRLSDFIFILGIVFVVLIFAINGDKFNPVFLYQEGRRANTDIGYVTLFDFVLPLGICISGKKRGKNRHSTLFMTFFLLMIVFLAVFAYGCIKGSMLYSISPLQIVFQISSSRLVKNYDGIFTLCVLFMFYGSVILIYSAYRILDFVPKKYKDRILFMLIPFIALNRYITAQMWITIQSAVVLIIAIERNWNFGEN